MKNRHSKRIGFTPATAGVLAVAAVLAGCADPRNRERQLETRYAPGASVVALEAALARMRFEPSGKPRPEWLERIGRAGHSPTCRSRGVDYWFSGGVQQICYESEDGTVTWIDVVTMMAGL